MQDIRAATSPQITAKLDLIQGQNKPTQKTPKIIPPALPNIENATQTGILFLNKNQFFVTCKIMVSRYFIATANDAVSKAKNKAKIYCTE